MPAGRAINEIMEYIPSEAKTIIDVGCGFGIHGFLLRTRRDLHLKRLVALDIWQPYLDFVKRFDIYDEIVKHDLLHLPLPFTDNEFDVCLRTEVLEHLPKKAALKSLDEVERIANIIIITTLFNILQT